MGFDIYGINPKLTTSKPARPENVPADEDLAQLIWNKYYEEVEEFESNNPGYYFRANVWWWRPIVRFLEEYADDILDAEDLSGMSENGGYSISGAKHVMLRDRLVLALHEGYIQQWVNTYTNMIQNLPQVTCHNCDGRGVLDSPPMFHDPVTWNGDCHVCNGSGKTDDFQKNYPTNLEIFEEFIAFLQHNDGFEVW